MQAGGRDGRGIVNHLYMCVQETQQCMGEVNPTRKRVHVLKHMEYVGILLLCFYLSYM